jgi:tRNA-dihydrouridine synthase C
VQLLGSDPAWLAGNAARLAALAPPGIDLNFGCPAKTVNRHGGGAMLLAEPERLFAIAEAVRRAVDASIPVTAKMRLGITDTARALDCAMALAEGGVAGLVVHARTKAEGYRPPAHWEWVARIGAAVDVPVVANGEIWTVADWRRCCALAGTRDVMLGRGAVSDPWLALRIRGARSPLPLAADWQALLPHLAAYWQGVRRRVLPEHAPGRLKLWLGMLRRTWPQEAGALLTALRAETDAEEVEKRLYAALRTGTT